MKDNGVNITLHDKVEPNQFMNDVSVTVDYIVKSLKK